MSSTFSESPLLRDADATLTDAGFLTRVEAIPQAESSWLLAENEFFVIAIVAAPTLDEAKRIEAFASAELLQRTSSLDVGGKLWDAYLVILCEELVVDPEAMRQLVAMQYDMRGVRRLVATSVTDRGPVVEALRSFLPLPPPMPGGLSDVFAALIDQLDLNGVDREDAGHYVTVFAETGSLDEA
jgi:hypothetical protein